MKDDYYFILKIAERVHKRLKKRENESGKKWLGPILSIQELMKLSDQRKEWRYQSYYRRNSATGKKRLVYSPIDAMKWLSQEIAKEIWEPFSGELHDCVHAYVQRRSHITNACAHVTSKEILEIDIQEAFPSVIHSQIIRNLRDYMPGSVATYIAGLVCVKGRLVPGNPMSPLIFLIVTRRLTKNLALLAERHNLVFTIFADNITLSGPKLPSNLEEEVCSLIRSEGFRPHPWGVKNHRMGSGTKRRKIVTGLEITDSGLALPKEKKVLARDALTQAFSSNLLCAIHPKKSDLKRVRERLTGRLAYATSIDPSIKRTLRRMLQDPEKRKTFKKNLRKDRARRIIRLVRQEQMQWQKYV